VTLDSGERAGVLTHPYLLSSFAYLDTSSPIHRGVLIMRNVLGRTLQPPPQAFTPLPADKLPNLTTRQRVALQTKPEFCNACHARSIRWALRWSASMPSVACGTKRTASH